MHSEEPQIDQFKHNESSEPIQPIHSFRIEHNKSKFDLTLPQSIQSPEAIKPSPSELPKFNLTLPQSIQSPKIPKLDLTLPQSIQPPEAIKPPPSELSKFNLTLPQSIQSPKIPKLDLTLPQSIQPPEAIKPPPSELPKFNLTLHQSIQPLEAIKSELPKPDLTLQQLETQQRELSTQQPKHPLRNQPPGNVSQHLLNPDQQANTVYRFALRTGASPRECRAFKQGIEILRQLNPNWTLDYDYPQPGEDEAMTLIYRDKDYIYRRAAYLITVALSNTLESVYGG